MIQVVEMFREGEKQTKIHLLLQTILITAQVVAGIIFGMDMIGNVKSVIVN